MRVEAALSVWLATVGLTGVAQAQDRPPPPIVTDFDGETLADHADLPATRPPSRPLPPIVTEFDATDEDGPYEPRIDEDEDQSEDVIEEDAAEERRHLQHAMLVERRRQMARSASSSSPSRARLLASPFATDARAASHTSDTSEPFALERADRSPRARRERTERARRLHRPLRRRSPQPCGRRPRCVPRAARRTHSSRAVGHAERIARHARCVRARGVHRVGHLPHGGPRPRSRSSRAAASST